VESLFLPKWYLCELNSPGARALKPWGVSGSTSVSTIRNIRPKNVIETSLFELGVGLLEYSSTEADPMQPDDVPPATPVASEQYKRFREAFPSSLVSSHAQSTPAEDRKYKLINDARLVLPKDRSRAWFDTELGTALRRSGSVLKHDLISATANAGRSDSRRCKACFDSANHIGRQTAQVCTVCLVHVCPGCWGAFHDDVSLSSATAFYEKRTEVVPQPNFGEEEEEEEEE
jgi:hypothetical protein